MNNGTMELLNFAELAIEARACSLAILDGDFDEARFRASILVAKAQKLDQPEVATSAAAAVRALGPAGHPPGTGYGARILAMAKALDAVRPEGLERDESLIHLASPPIGAQNRK